MIQNQLLPISESVIAHLSYWWMFFGIGGCASLIHPTSEIQGDAVGLHDLISPCPFGVDVVLVDVRLFWWMLCRIRNAMRNV